MKKSTIRVEKVIIPTYLVGKPDKNPMFMEKRVYQGSSGKVYPHTVTDKVSDTKCEKEYTAIFMENEYILVMVLPELGGRIQRLYDKTNGYDAIYYNEVIKPALVGLAGPWISGGIEFNWPQHHRPSTFDPLPFKVQENNDGSVTTFVGEVEKMFHTSSLVAFTVYPDKAYLEVKGTLYNPTERTQTFLWWANPAVSVNDYTQSIFPPDVHAVMDHGKRDVSKFPIADGVYYKMDYSPGTDITRYKNIPVPTSYMAYHSDYDFIGNYDHNLKAGLLHIADHHISTGKKQWTWGNGDFGKAWDRNLTDENGPYIELMTGMFTDNQPDFTFIAPYEEKNFVQYFMPYKDVGAVKNANVNIVVNLELEGSKAKVIAYSPVVFENVLITLESASKCIFKVETNISPTEVFEKTVEIGENNDIWLIIYDSNGKELIWQGAVLKKTEEEIPSSAEEAKAPKDIATIEELYLTAVHLEQYRHATYNPKDYYLEGLRRDETDIRLNTGYGKILYNEGLFSESEKYFRKAIKKATWKNPNPYDSEPYYLLGLSLEAQFKFDEAYDAYYKAVWSDQMKDKAYYRLALLAIRNNQIELAKDFCELSIDKNRKNTRALNLLAHICGLLCEKDLGIAVLESCSRINPLDLGCLYEKYCLSGEGSLVDEIRKVSLDDPHYFIDAALNYIQCGAVEKAVKLLKLCTKPDDMLNYYLAYCTLEKEYIELAENSKDFFGFTNRLFDITVLEDVICLEKNAGKAKYYLGNIYYDRGRYDEAAELWESSLNILNDFPTNYRNLALYYYNKKQEHQKAKEYLEIAFYKNNGDSRVFFELDQLYKILNYSVEYRLEFMEKYIDLIEDRDDLYTEYITLLNSLGKHQEALSSIERHIFHPWEGGEGKITAQYKEALIGLSESVENPEEILLNALTLPVNLGEGKLYGTMDNDIYYLLGKATGKKEYFEKAVLGGSVLGNALYYNDQPPEMFYYRALAYGELGDREKSERMLNTLVNYGKEHKNDVVEIDYFAVSLPDFLIFERDLNIKNYVNCCYLAALGYFGLGHIAEGEKLVKKAFLKDKSHIGVLKLLNLCKYNDNI